MDSPSNIRTPAKACLLNMCDRAVSMRVPSLTKQHVFLRCSGPLLEMLLIRRRFVTQKDSVAGGALLQASAGAVHLAPKPATAKGLFEFFIIPSRPNRQHPAPLVSRISAG